MPRALNSIDAELEVLELQLRAIENDEIDNSSAEDDDALYSLSSQPELSKHECDIKLLVNSNATVGDGVVLIGNGDLERIKPLPVELLPEGNDYRGKGQSVRSFLGERRNEGLLISVTRHPSGNPSMDSDPNSTVNSELSQRLARRRERPRCEVCALDFTSDTQYTEHCLGKKHLKIFRKLSTNGRHRNHQRYVKPPRDQSHCVLCRKIFTSDSQKAEHEGGKWHRQRVAGVLPPSNAPYVS